MSSDDTPLVAPRRPPWAVWRLTIFALIVLAGYPLFHETLTWVAWVFNDDKQDMGHGWGVPLFSLYLLWRRRAALRAAVAGASWRGLACCLPGLLLYWIGARGDQVRLSQFALIWLLWSVPYALWGGGVARLLIMPVGFLLFTVPMAFLDFFTLRLRLLAAAMSQLLLNGIGIPVQRLGTGLHSMAGAGFDLDVADPCSGLRSIFALTAITAAYAYLTQRSLWQKWLLFLCSMPIAIVGNMMRIFTIAIVAKFFGQEAGTGFYHDYSGYVVFLIGILLMMSAGSGIARLGRARAGTPPVAGPATATAAAAAPLAGNFLAPLFALMLFLAIGVLMRLVPPPFVEPQRFLADSLPAQIGNFRGQQPWFCHNEQCRRVFEEDELRRAAPDGRLPTVCPTCGGKLLAISLGELTVLPADTLILRHNYQNYGGDTLSVVVVVNGASRMSIHRPELCLPGQGYSIDRMQIARFTMDDRREIHVKLVDVRRPSRSGMATGRMGEAYFFVSASHQTASHFTRILTSAFDRAVRNRITCWAMVVVYADRPFDTPERLRLLEGFVTGLYAQLRAPPPPPAGAPP